MSIYEETLFLTKDKHIKTAISNKKWQENHKEEFDQIINFIYSKTDFLKKEYSLVDRIRLYLLGYKQEPICKTCGANNISFNPVLKKFSEFCSVKCSRNHKDTLQKQKDTNLLKYGTTHHLKNKDILQKQKNTNLLKYGVENISNTKNAIIKANNTKKINQKKWYHNKDDFEKKFKECDSRVLLLEKATNTENCTLYKYAKLYGLETNKDNRSSLAEKEIVEFLSQNNITNIISNTKDIIPPKEIDIFLPDYNLAIEYNGLYWHSYPKRDKNYHLDKLNDCENKGIRLIQIFENEWLSKKDIVKSRLLNAIGKTNKIYARNCEIKIVDNKTSNDFLDSNHIQGKAYTNINYGLYHNNELVSIMTFCKARFSKSYDYELVRFCNKLNFTVVGGASKLFKHFICNNTGSIVSYADKRWNTGNLYETLGFEYSHESQPNYWYWLTEDSLESRIKYQKHKLKSFNEYSDELTEFEIMLLNGYNKIYDCGNKVFVYKNDPPV